VIGRDDIALALITETLALALDGPTDAPAGRGIA
jgi:hypothetical protein